MEVDTYLGHAETWFDRARAGGAPESRAAARAAVDDERTFVDLARSTLWIGKEHVVVDRW